MIIYYRVSKWEDAGDMNKGTYNDIKAGDIVNIAHIST